MVVLRKHTVHRGEEDNEEGKGRLVEKRVKKDQR